MLFHYAGVGTDATFSRHGGNKHLDAFEPWALTLQGKLHPTGVIYRTAESKTTGAKNSDKYGSVRGIAHVNQTF